MSATRCNYWPEKLDLFIQEKRDQAFDWGTNNCAFFAADWVTILVGLDLAAEYRDKITSPLAAYRAVEAAGEVDAIAAEQLAAAGFPEIPLIYARRGDVVTTHTRHGPAMGVLLGHCAAFAGTECLEFIPTTQLLRAWKIA
jgi:hypothetical protein